MGRLSGRIYLLIFLITLIGIITIYSSTVYSPSLNERTMYIRQIIWLVLAVIVFWGVSKIYYRRLWDIAYILYAIGVVFLLAVAISGLIRLGAQRWIKIFWFNFQPSELMKLIIVIFLARYFSKPIWGLRYGVKHWGFLRSVLIPFGFVCLPVFLIIEQPDLGTAVSIFIVFLAMLFVAQVNFRYIFFILLGIILTMPFFWSFLKDYQKSRVLVFLNPNADPLGAGYTIIQSKTAIASGNIFGRGFLSGSQSQLQFLPESHTDFIFATFAEEWGFLGVAVLFLLYYFLVRAVLKIAVKSSDNFARLLASGIAIILVVQFFINIAMTIGLAPVVGLPLPFLSYGGSCLLIIFIAMGIIINIEKRFDI